MDEANESETAPIDNARTAQQTSPEPAHISIWKKISDTLRHPVILLLVTTGLTYSVIPKITETSRLHQARVKEALELIERSSEVDRNLNALLTTLELFQKDNSGAAARLVKYKNEQVELRKIMNARYLEFDKVAWWWPRNASTEAALLNLTSPEESSYIGERVESYVTNLTESTKVLSNLWDAFLRKEYNPADPQNDVNMKNTHDKLYDLAGARRKLILDLANAFSSK